MTPRGFVLLLPMMLAVCCGCHGATLASDGLLPSATTQAGFSIISRDWRSLPNDIELQVTCCDGKRLTGRIDPRSTDQWLWLTIRASEQASVSTLVPTATIHSVAIASQPADTSTVGAPSSSSAVAPAVATSQLSTSGRQAAASLAVAMRQINVDADASLDGIELQLVISDRYGNPLLKSGTAVIGLDIYNVDVHDQVELRQSESWTRQVKPGDLHASGGRLQLRFREIDLRRNASQYLLAVASVTLRVPGEAVLQAKSDFLPVRP